MKRLIAVAVLLSLGVVARAQAPGAGPARTIVYLVRHGETDNSQQTRPLSAAGVARARVLAMAVREVAFTHVFSSHTTRTRQMVEPIATARGLKVVQLPTPGTLWDGRPVSDTTPTRAAAGPLTDALRRLPPGSRALVGINRENVFAVMNGLGVAVPCLDASCFPGGRDGDYDHLWIVTVAAGSPPQMVDRRYQGSVATQRSCRPAAAASRAGKSNLRSYSSGCRGRLLAYVNDGPARHAPIKLIRRPRIAEDEVAAVNRCGSTSGQSSSTARSDGRRRPTRPLRPPSWSNSHHTLVQGTSAGTTFTPSCGVAS